MLGLALEDEDDEEGASALGAGVVVELLELEAGGVACCAAVFTGFSRRSQPAKAATAISKTIWNRIGFSYFVDSLFDSLFVSLLGLVALEDDDEEGASALGAGVVVELLELEAGGVDCGAIVTDVDEDEGGCELDAEGAGVLDELLELDGLESARGVVTVVDDEDDVLPGVPAGPAGPCRSQPASATAPTPRATAIRCFFMRVSLRWI